MFKVNLPNQFPRDVFPTIMGSDDVNGHAPRVAAWPLIGHPQTAAGLAFGHGLAMRDLLDRDVLLVNGAGKLRAAF